MTKPEEKTPETASLSFGDLKKLIVETAQEVIGKTGKPSETKSSESAVKETSDLDSQVQKAIAKLKADEEREKKEKERDDTIAGLVQKTQQKPPVERSRVHKMMGWGD